MSDALLLAVIVGIPIGWHAGLVGFTYYDAGRLGLPRRKWTAVVLLVPLFGFFVYVFERSERDYDPTEDPYTRREYDFHDPEGQAKNGGSDQRSSPGEQGRDP